MRKFCAVKHDMMGNRTLWMMDKHFQALKLLLIRVMSDLESLSISLSCKSSQLLLLSFNLYLNLIHKFISETLFHITKSTESASSTNPTFMPNHVSHVILFILKFLFFILPNITSISFDDM